MIHLRQLARILRTDGAVGAIALILTITVACLLMMHPIAGWYWGDRGPWDIYLEAGMLSVFGWAMWFWGGLLAFGLAARERAWSLLVWSGVLGLLLYDDALELHERLGGRLRTTPLDDVPGPPSLLVFAAIGAVCLTSALVARAFAQPTARGVHTTLIVFLAVGACIGVGADVMQGLPERGSFWWLLVTLVEQVGEAMTSVAIVVALIAWIGNGIDPARTEARWVSID